MTAVGRPVRPRPQLRLRAAVRAAPRRVPAALTAPLGLLVLLALSAAVRTRGVNGPLWLDEGLSIGIASHHLSAIPALLRQDGSPPLYYLLLHVWMAVAGRSETATHLLSVVFGLATVPVAWWFGRTLWGDRAAWACATLFALDPALSFHSVETRMYSLEGLLTLLVAGALVACFVQRRRGFAWLQAGALAALLYTHNWGLFLFACAAVVGAVLVALGPDRRGLARDAAIAFGVPVLAYLPWVPTLLFQARHTGAPWSSEPGLYDLLRVRVYLLGTPIPVTAMLIAAVTAAFALARRGPRLERRAALVLAAVTAGTLLLAWGYNQHASGWASRYLSVLLGPGLLLGGLLIARAGVTGLAAIVLIAVPWLHQPDYRSVAHKSNVRYLAHRVTPRLRPGDLILDAQPESVPVVRYYFGPAYRYASPLGPYPDTGIMDWRDVLARMRATTVRGTVALADHLRPGTRVAVLLPLIKRHPGNAAWTRLVRARAVRLAHALGRDPRLRWVMRVHAGRHGSKTTLRAVVYARRRT